MSRCLNMTWHSCVAVPSLQNKAPLVARCPGSPPEGSPARRCPGPRSPATRSHSAPRKTKTPWTGDPCQQDGAKDKLSIPPKHPTARPAVSLKGLTSTNQSEFAVETSISQANMKSKNRPIQIIGFMLTSSTSVPTMVLRSCWEFVG